MSNEFWSSANQKKSAYSIMFQVEDHCPIYMDTWREWSEYYKESQPSNVATCFILESENLTLPVVYAYHQLRLAIKDTLNQGKITEV